MKISADEVYSIVQALEARKEWCKEMDGNKEELPFIESALCKFQSLGFTIESEEQ
jgi:hypothetical protein